MMTMYNFNALSIEKPKDKKLPLGFLYEKTIDIKHSG